MQLNRTHTLFKSVKYFLVITLFACFISISANSSSKANVNLPVVNTDSVIKKSSFENFYRYMARTIRYPKDAREDNIQGKVFVVFNIDDNHKAYNIGILKGLYDMYNSQNNEVIRALKAYTFSSDMKQNINYNMPIYFDIQGNIDSKVYVRDKPFAQEYKKTAFPNQMLSEVVIIGYAQPIR